MKLYIYIQVNFFFFLKLLNNNKEFDGYNGEVYNKNKLNNFYYRK